MHHVAYKTCMSEVRCSRECGACLASAAARTTRTTTTTLMMTHAHDIAARAPRSESSRSGRWHTASPCKPALGDAPTPVHVQRMSQSDRHMLATSCHVRSQAEMQMPIPRSAAAAAVGHRLLALHGVARSASRCARVAREPDVDVRTWARCCQMSCGLAGPTNSKSAARVFEDVPRGCSPLRLERVKLGQAASGGCTPVRSGAPRGPSRPWRRRRP
jgi:hypothetical protein